MAIDKEKRANLEQIAKSSPLLKNTPSELKLAVLIRMCIPRDGSFCYFRIPKAANSTIVKTLGAHYYEDANKVKINALKARFARHPKVRELDGDELLAKAFCWTVVRNPFSRVLSCYYSKIRDPKFAARRHPDLADRLSGMSLSDFLVFLNDGGLLQDPHWAPQTELLPIPASRLHFVGRVESLDRDLPIIMQKITNSFDGIVDHSRGRRGSGDNVASEFGSTDRRMVEKLYARDFEELYPGP